MSNKSRGATAQEAFVGTVQRVLGNAIAQDQQHQISEELRMRIAVKFSKEAQRNLYFRVLKAYVDFMHFFRQYDAKTVLSSPRLEDVTITDIYGELVADFTFRPYPRRCITVVLDGDQITRISGLVAAEYPGFEAVYWKDNNTVVCRYTASTLSLADGSYPALERHPQRVIAIYSNYSLGFSFLSYTPNKNHFACEVVFAPSFKNHHCHSGRCGDGYRG